jgi:hypothetical protein
MGADVVSLARLTGGSKSSGIKKTPRERMYKRKATDAQLYEALSNCTVA